MATRSNNSAGPEQNRTQAPFSTLGTHKSLAMQWLA